jgi:hypothetical protein
VNDTLRIGIIFHPRSIVEQMANALEEQWTEVRDEVVAAAGDQFARTVDQLVADAQRLTEKRPPDFSQRLWAHASVLLTAGDVLGAPVSADQSARQGSVQNVGRIASALLDLRAALAESDAEVS